MAQKIGRNKSYDETIIEMIQTEKPQTTAQLLELTTKTGIDANKVLEILFHLEKEGQINLDTKTSKTHLTLSQYITSSGTRWFWATVILAIVTTVMIMIPENVYLLVYPREILGVIFVLVLPGYILTKALFPAQGNSEFDLTERAALSIGVSLTLIPIIGLILNFSPWGITLDSTVLSILSLTILFAAIAFTREYNAKS